MKRVSPLPSLLTVGNFTCGFIAIVLCLQALQHQTQATLLTDLCARPSAGPVETQARDWASLAGRGQERGQELLRWAYLAIFLAMVFDMLDGRVARMTGAESRFGGELDSLADGCSFGVAPAIVVVTLWIEAQPAHAKWWSLVMICGAAYAACAILRLARYNVESGSADKNYFTGLPSPAAAGAVASAVFFCQEGYLDPLWKWLVERWLVTRVPPVDPAEMQARALGIYMLVIGLLMVTRLRFVHVTNRYLTGRRRFTSLVAAIFLAVLLCEKPAEVLFLAFNGYVAVSLIGNLRRHLSRTPAAAIAAGEDGLPPAESDHG